ncbi:RseC/MucC-like positive regulator of sigma(E) [Desulfobotulus alkaliphilus]|uniref:RseC/MucC-like positive regulator of sigma(E) n=1 Tax=Desulfobotulus alkaliphilus TaxID=622671 RepID=A0A562R6B9_9BACT|nr:SoxR reducing system RseC family protein [Desulfobotulus alkaliphilus]TWI64619.1 RseC/MucC-like positive regulator of sigma(E) [Desulfobotulus alkaliphilus]
MRTTEAIVTFTSGENTRIQACRPEACAACKARSVCAVDPANMEIEVKALPGLKAGDRVLVGIGNREFVRVMALLYVSPVVFFVGAALAAHHAAIRLHLPADPLAAAAGLLSLALAFFIIRHISGKLSCSPAYGPRILKRIKGPEPSAFPDNPMSPPPRSQEKTEAIPTKTKR